MKGQRKDRATGKGKERGQERREGEERQEARLDSSPLFERISVLLAIFRQTRFKGRGSAKKHGRVENRHEWKQSRDARETVAAGYYVPGTSAV